MNFWDITWKIIKGLEQIWKLELYNSGSYAVRLNQIIIAFLVIIVGIIFSKRISEILGKRISKISGLHHNTSYIIQRLLFYGLILIIVCIALPIAGIPMTIFTVLGGAVAIGVGFGAQNLFNNLISGFIIMLEKPIRIGDIIELHGNEGKVQDIGNRCVRVRRSDGIDLIVPNSEFLQNLVINWTLYDGNVRGTIDVGVAYGSHTEKVNELLLQIANDHPKILRLPDPPIVVFEEFGDNSLAFKLLFWCHVTRPMDLRRLKSEIRFSIDQLFRENSIVISFPQRDIHLDTTKPLEIKFVGDKTENPNTNYIDSVNKS